MLLIENLEKKFGGTKVLNGVYMEVKTGEVVGLIGPNGAGKTTLINVISGYLKADNGKIYFNGKDISNLPHYKLARIGVVRTFQIPKPFHSLTLYENFLVPLINSKKESDILNGKLEDLLNFLELHHKKNFYPTHLTAADLRLLELIRAYLMRPKLLLLDEPFVSLSEYHIDKLKIILDDLAKNSSSIVIVEHNIPIVRKISKRLLVMNEGKIIADGKPEEILNDSYVMEVYFGKKG